MGAGPCLLSCGPVLISYIAGTKKTALQGLYTWLVFSLSRFFATVLLGLIAGLLGAGLFSRFYYEVSGYLIWLAAGIFICFLGLLLLVGILEKFKFCSVLNYSFIRHDTKSLMILGFLMGLLPCMPFAGVISYITMASAHYIQGVLMAAAFGLGTAISPLILLAAAAGAIPGLKFLQGKRAAIILQRICGIILIYFGVQVIINALAGL